MRSIGLFGCASSVLLMVACAPSPLAERWPESRPLGRDLAVYRPPLQPPGVAGMGGVGEMDSEDEQQIQEPTDKLTLRQAFALSLVRNADLRSFAWEVRAAEARTLQTSLRPNPQLDIEAENVAGSGDFKGADAAETTLGLSQLIELGGKRSKRTRVASLAHDLAGWDYEAQRIAVLTEVAKRFIEVLSSQRRVELAQEAAELSEQFYDTVEKRIEAGAASPVEKIRASVVISTSRIELHRSERQLQAARHQLAAIWGNTNPRFEKVSGDLNAITDIPSAQSLVRLVNQNPDVARWAVEMTQRHAAVALAKAQGVPDITIGAGYRRLSESDDDVAVFGLSFPLPIFDRNQGGILEARFNVAKAQEQRRAAELRVGLALRTIYQELAATHTEATMLKQDVLPAARASFDATQEAFRQGKLSFLDVLDVQRTLVDVQSQYLDALRAYHNAVAEVEGLIGQSLSAVQNNVPQTDEIQTEPETPDHE